MLQHWFYKPWRRERLFWDHGCCSQRRINPFIVSAVASSWRQSNTNQILQKIQVFKSSEHENSFDHQRAFKETAFNDKIRKVNYFVIILDSMPDISHTDQMSFICWYIVLEDKEVEVRESFLGFITEHWKTAYDIQKIILDRLEKEKLDLKNYTDRILWFS